LEEWVWCTRCFCYLTTSLEFLLNLAGRYSKLGRTRKVESRDDILQTLSVIVFACQKKLKCLKVEILNEGKSAARFCHQVASWVPDMFCDIYLVKSHKNVINSASTEAR